MDFFDDPDAEQEEWQYAHSVQKGHGRLEIREIWTSTQMNGWFCSQYWFLLKSAFYAETNKTRKEALS